jgi:hypothetical protein
MKRNFIFLIFIFLICFLNAKVEINIPKLENPPVIDGVISADEWSEAVRWDDFYQTSPGDNTEPSERTEVFLAYDENNIYCMAKCHFKDISRLRNFHCSRDQIYTTDRVYFFFDTFHSNTQAYYFGCNANGEQADGIIIDDIDTSIDLFYYSAGGINTEGFVIELALPLESIKYKSGKNVDWGVFFIRHIPDGPEKVSGFRVPRGGGNFYDNYGILRFAELPNNMNLKLIPSLTGNYNQFQNNLNMLVEETDSELQPELNIFFEPNSNLTFTATVNPDFNIIEADGLEIEVNSRYPRYYQEKRPFFIEQSNPFSTDLIIFNTRNIVDPLWGTKLSGSVSKMSIYGLLAVDEDTYGDRFGYADTLKSDAIFAFLSLNKKLRNGNSFLRAAATMRSFHIHENFLVSLDANNRFNDEIDADFQLVYTSNEIEKNNVLETKLGYGYSVDMDYYNGTWFINFESNGITEDYTADLGYIYDKNSIFNKNRIEYQIHGKTDKDFLRYMEIASTQHIKTTFDLKDIRSHYWELMCGAIFNNNFDFWTGLEMTMENYLGKDYYMYYPWLSLNYELFKQLKVSFLIVDGKNLFFGDTQVEIADYYKYETTLNIRPVNFFDLEFKHKYHETAGKYIARTYEAKAKLQFHKNFWFRAIVQYTNHDMIAWEENPKRISFYPLFTYKPSSKTAIYLGASRTEKKTLQPLNIDLENYEDTTYFMKVSYTFDLF